MITPDCSPICIASPARRSGTTLLQRLISSSTNSLIYGESCANDVQFLINLLVNKQAVLGSSLEWRNQQLQSVLEGQVNTWIPDLMPDVEYYLQTYKGLIFSLVRGFENFAKEKGRPVWGMKLPEWHPAGLKQLHSILPNSKIIYLHRNLEDCVRSAKGIDMLRGPEEIQQFCQIWKQYTDYSKEHLKGQRVLHLQYEELVQEPEKWITAIEEFTGTKGVDREVMKVKVNTYDNDHKLETEDPYLKPAQLTEEELAIVNSFSVQIARPLPL